MTEKTAQEKLALRIDHWIEHNAAHEQEFRKGAETAGELDLKDVCEEMLSAAEKLNVANEHLRRAVEKLARS